MALGLILAALLSLPVQAQEQGAFNSACFLGLNDADSPATLGSCESPDLLNTESNLNGTAILKRKGFQLFGTLTYSTSPVNGSHSFIDSNGNRLDIVCHDRVCSKSTNGNAFASFLSSAGSGSSPPTRWSFVDVGGNLYGANDRRDPILKYTGTTLSYPTGMPAGSILELTQDRLVVGDISGQPNRVHYSSAGAYTEFTLGVNNEDSYFDDVGAPGDKIRGLKYLGGVLYIFKTASISACELGNQYTSACAILSPNIGTTDPASIVAAGPSLYFRAQDKNYWEIGPQGLRQISKKIPNLIKSQSGGLGGGENSNTQTTQADWQAGTQSPANTWNTTIINGSIFPSSSSLVDTSSNAFSSGTFTGTGAMPDGSLSVGAVGLNYYIHYGGENDPTTVTPVWTLSNTGGTEGTTDGSTWTVRVIAGTNNGYINYTSSLLPSTTVNHLIVARAKTRIDPPSFGRGSLGFYNTSTSKFVGRVYLSTFSANYDWAPTEGVPPESVSTQTVLDNGVSVAESFSTYTVLMTTYNVVRFWRNGVFKASGTVTGTFDSVILGVDNSVLTAADPSNRTIGMDVDFFYYASNVADPGNSDIPSIATFTSRIFDMGFSTAILGPLLSTVTIPTGTAITYQVRSSTSPNNDMWTTYESVTPPNRPTSYANRYHQYKLTLAQINFTSAPVVSGVLLQGVTTGQYTTQCIQPNSSISAWGALNCATTLAGNGSLVFYATSAATCATLPAAVPNSWQTSVTNNATLSIATNTAVVIGWRSLLGSATDQAQVDSCVLNWNEGTPAQPAWATYDSIKNAVYWTTTINNAVYSNRLLKYDRNLEQWYPFDIPAQAPRVINNSLYFGGASSGTWNLYGGVDADLGAAINAFWRSKDIGSDRPFQAKNFKPVSLLARNAGTGNLSLTYTFSNSETGAYTVSLSTGSGISYSRYNENLPGGSSYNFVNLKVGNNSATPFEVLGLGVGWTVLPWKVGGP